MRHFAGKMFEWIFFFFCTNAFWADQSVLFQRETWNVILKLKEWKIALRPRRYYLMSAEIDFRLSFWPLNQVLQIALRTRICQNRIWTKKKFQLSNQRREINNFNLYFILNICTHKIHFQFTNKNCQLKMFSRLQTALKYCWKYIIH
jgi:hypothetical protein